MSGVPFHVAGDSVPVYMFGEHRFRFLATGEETNGSYGVMEVVSPEGTGPGPHTHADSEEHFLVLSGEVVFGVGGETFTAKPGDLVHVPRQTVHEFKVSASSATMVATFTPAGDEQVLRDGSVLRDDA